MENDEVPGQAPDPAATPPRAVLEALGLRTLVPLQGGRSPVWRTERGILRGGPEAVIDAQATGATAFTHAFPRLASAAPRPTAAILRDQGHAWLLEEDLGEPVDASLERIEPLTAAFLADRAETVLAQGTLRTLLRLTCPWMRPKASRLVAALRAARRAGSPLPFAPHLGAIERALDSPLELALTRTWAHGGLAPGRVLEGGACHWRHFGPDHWLGEDQAPFVAPDPDDPAATLLVLAWAWRNDPIRAADALLALGLVAPAPPRWVQISLSEPHPCLTAADLERLLGTPLGRVSATAAARALGRARGLLVAGSPIRLEATPTVRPRRAAAPWRIRDRDPRRLFSRWHEGIQIDTDARASLTPEAPALDIARRLHAATVVDGFCGAGGNTIALARMPWCRQVVAVDLDPARLAMARHNATIYGVEGKIRFVEGNFLELAPSLAGADACFLDPPWDAGRELARSAWTIARRHFPKGALELPRQDSPPPDASHVETVFGVGSVISFVLAWWGL